MSIIKLASSLFVGAAIVFGITSPSNATVIHQDGSGHLTIFGTSQNDHLEIYSHGNGPGIREQGLRIHYANVVGNQVVHTFDNVQSVEILTFEGNDSIVFSADYFGDVHIDTGSGSDDVRFYADELNGSPYIFGDTTVITGSGEDAIRSWEFCFWGNLEIETGTNDDEVWLDYSHISELNIQTNRGSDWVQLWGCRVSRETDIRLGQDRDVLFLARTAFVGTAFFRGGPSNDDLGNYWEVTALRLFVWQDFEQGNFDNSRR